ncbi:nitroreductase/quinone reductase family protein [Williamsia phyllosphaerae]|uniref:DUF385 domain-containing protein n=1 Tax=Williamsia phyllosphaerae TaxID=885042 RepID=A0ABQ1U5D7_9NOCA|nr:nitroreductase/quinone reductase family protein [Williamsia phyllosphaerae]GGF10410.1 hypothetical protein GCM10007298_02950 [Williamsia phyllosphaerae]
MNTFQKSAAVWNKFFVTLMKAPVLEKVLGKSTALITYTGRKSGKSFSLPVSYKRDGDALAVAVMMPDKKNWWRNFDGDGGRVMVEIAGVARPGHAVTVHDPKGRMSVSITLDPVGS